MLLSQSWIIKRNCTFQTVKMFQKCHSSFLFNRLYFVTVLDLQIIISPGLDRAMTNTERLGKLFCFKNSKKQVYP